MYDLRPYAELKIEEVTPASIMYKLESIHRRLNESYNQIAADKKIDVTLSIGADDVYWASALLNALTSRQKDVSVRSFKHSTHGGTALPALTTLAFNESAPISVTVVIKANDDVGPSVSLGSRKHGPVVGWMAVWKLLGRLGGLYPTETGAFADTATRMDFWLAKAMTLARGDEKTKEVTAREMSAFLGRCDFLGAVDGLSLTDVVVYGLLCRNDKNASNLESWLDRCRAVGVKACCC
uniref:Uncharacterized protein n=1 Tax=Plectus sambesii TaxID=2011161 RepID=A0A914XBA2_9BILA